VTSISFENAADFYDETRGGLRRGGNFATVIDGFLPRSARVLEVGIGTALIALPLTERGHIVCGIDIAPAMLARAHERIGARVAVADAQALPVATAACNVALVVWVMHVVADRDALLRECARVLEPGGTLIVVPAHPREPDNDCTRILQALRVRLDRVFTVESEVLIPADRAGFRVVADAALPIFEPEQTPHDLVTRIEAREWSGLWNLTDDQWHEKVQPALDALRALPDPDRTRGHAPAHHAYVFEKSA
jgi:SAM-dependent methyltransferase